MAEVYVFNASPLILLSRIDGLPWLAAIGSERLVPARVLEELRAGAARDAAAAEVAAASGLTVVDVGAIDPRVVAWGLDPGESHVLTLALARDAIAVLDDRAARRAASALGIRIAGTLGTIALLARLGVVADAASVFARLREAGLYLDDDLVARVLAEIAKAP